MKKVIFTFLMFLMIMCVSPVAVNADMPSADIDLTNVFDEHGAAMMLIDPQTGQILYVNDSAALFYEYTKDELESMNISQINTLSEEEIALEMQAAQNEERNYFVFDHRLKNGDIRNVEVYSYPVQFNGKTVLFSIVYDITEQTLLRQQAEKRDRLIFIAGGVGLLVLLGLFIVLAYNRRKLKISNQKLESSNELFESFIDANESLMYLKDEKLKYLFVNAAFLKAYNKIEEEIIGKDDFALSVDAFANMRRKSDMSVLEKREVVTDTIEWNNKVYESIKFPVKLINGQIGIGAYVREVTLEKNRQKQLQKMLYRHKIISDAFSHLFSNTQQQLDYVLHRALNLTESKYGYIYFYNEETQEFMLNSWTKGVMEECAVAKPQTIYQLAHTGIWGEVVRQRKPLIVNDFAALNPLKKGYPSGHVALTNFMSIPVFVDEKIVAVVGMANKDGNYDEHDVTELTMLMAGTWNAVERREKQEKLSYERNKYLQTIVSIGDGIMVVDNDGNIEMINAIAEKLTGWTLNEAKGKHYKEVFKLSHEMKGFEINDPVEAALRTGQIQELGNHAILTSRYGEQYYLEDSAAPIKNDKEDILGVILVFRDVTDKREQRRKIEYLSFHDSLTGLYNRRFFEEELNRLDTHRNLPICVIMGDVNGLKLTNDIFGHTFGDMLLKTVARVLTKVFRADDIIARWGGDEFVILLYQTNMDEAQLVMNRIKEEFEKEQNMSIKVSISMGADIKTQMEETIWDVLSRAEERMYTNKSLERNKYKEEALDSITKLLYTTSPEEKEHAKAVSRLCYEMGKMLALPKTDILKLKEAGYLHDIGKIVLDSNLIKNSDQATDEECCEIKNHPVISYRILNAFDHTMDLADIVLAHHEYWNGSGYPKGLKETEILLAARIIAVADCYDRMVSGYGGRDLVSSEEAIDYIKKNADILFEPKIVDAFVKLISAEQMDE
jgi:diguanylate cyclase (GGDEF)-like protein/PAS domain S-box-containing protein/putative nucleotidyltransferase with HDIG domain